MTSETSHVKHKVKQIKLSPRYKQLQNNSGRRKGEVKPELRDSAHGDPRGPTPQGKVPLIRVSESCNRVRLMPPLFVRTFHSFLLSLRPLTLNGNILRKKRTRKIKYQNRRKGRPVVREAEDWVLPAHLSPDMTPGLQTTQQMAEKLA